MSGRVGKCCRIHHIVRLRQLLKRCCEKALSTLASHRGIPTDVPAGYVAVTVGSSRTRFLVRASCLNHPVFRKLLAEAEEEYGFDYSGPISVPCDEKAFRDATRCISSSDIIRSKRLPVIQNVSKRYHLDVAGFSHDSKMETAPLLQRLAESWQICRVHNS